jgi:hypothetical protein
MAWDLFLSFPTSDEACARSLCTSLGTAARVFFAPQSIRLGSDWPAVVDQALEESRMVVVLVTEATADAPYQQEEITRALELARRRQHPVRIIPLLVGAGVKVPFGLSRKQAVVVARREDVAAAVPPLLDALETLEPLADHRFSDPLRIHLESLHQVIESLTNEQVRVIRQLRYLRRARISGCAGSGKTLIAAEKATRMAAAGQQVLFLCHNPLLADHVARLTAGTGVHVLDFGTWVARIAMTSEPPREGWHHFEEPSQGGLDCARRTLGNGPLRYDAILVDEAQDFRDEWWAVVEAALRPGDEAVFYLFHDDHQSLLPHRGHYPIVEPHIDLSRNCRNAGRIFELMRCFDSSLPETELRLRTKGNVRLTLYEPGEELANLASIFNELHGVREDTVLLWSGADRVQDSPIAEREVRISSRAFSWKIPLRGVFDLLLTNCKANGTRKSQQIAPRVDAVLNELSSFAYPSAADIEKIAELARVFRIPTALRGRHPGRRPLPVKIFERFSDYHSRYPGYYFSEILRQLQEGQWVDSIPHEVVRTVPYFAPRTEATVPVYGVSDFKGLEADAVILVMRGRSASHRQAMYVGISRARALLLILADKTAAADLPREFPWDSGWGDARKPYVPPPDLR